MIEIDGEHKPCLDTKDLIKQYTYLYNDIKTDEEEHRKHKKINDQHNDQINKLQFARNAQIKIDFSDSYDIYEIHVPIIDNIARIDYLSETPDAYIIHFNTFFDDDIDPGITFDEQEYGPNTVDFSLRVNDFEDDLLVDYEVVSFEYNKNIPKISKTNILIESEEFGNIQCSLVILFESNDDIPYLIKDIVCIVWKNGRCDYKVNLNTLIEERIKDEMDDINDVYGGIDKLCNTYKSDTSHIITKYSKHVREHILSQLHDINEHNKNKQIKLLISWLHNTYKRKYLTNTDDVNTMMTCLEEHFDMNKLDLLDGAKIYDICSEKLDMLKRQCRKCTNQYSYKCYHKRCRNCCTDRSCRH
jgi:hypothetical protein